MHGTRANLATRVETRATISPSRRDAACGQVRRSPNAATAATFEPMKIPLFLLVPFVASVALAAPVPIFDGKTFDGWEGDTAKTWRIEDGAFVGGSLTEKVPHNEFLATKKTYANFELRLKFKLTGTEGQINARRADPHPSASRITSR